MPGRTDAGILYDAADGARRRSTGELARFRSAYLAHLATEVDKPGPRKGIMPGVRPLLDSLADRSDVYLALLTGNYEEAARVKLEYFDLWRYFPLRRVRGRCARTKSVSCRRRSMRIRQCGGPVVGPADVVVIGDTPLDVACAAAAGRAIDRRRDRQLRRGCVAVDRCGCGAGRPQRRGRGPSSPANVRSGRYASAELAEAPGSRTQPPRVSGERPILKTGRATGPRSLPERSA